MADNIKKSSPNNECCKIWYEDISLFFEGSKLLEFWPSKSMGIEERINATSRFLLYASLLLFATTQKVKYLVFGAFLIGILSFVYYQSTNNTLAMPSKTKDAQEDAGNHESFQFNRDYLKLARFLNSKEF